MFVVSINIVQKDMLKTQHKLRLTNRESINDGCFIGIISFLAIVINILAFNGEPIEGEAEILYFYSCYVYVSYLKLLGGSFFLIFVAILLSAIRSKKEIAVGRIVSWILWVLTSILMFVLFEGIAGNILTIESRYLLKNLVIFYVIYLVFCTVIRRQSFAAIIYCSAMSILALAEYYVLSFRNRPLMLFDIWGVGTAAGVAGRYSYKVPVNLGWWLLGVLLLLVFQYYLQELTIHRKKWIVALRIIYVGVFTAFVLLILKTDFMRKIGVEPVILWALQSNYQEKGSLYTLYLECQYVYIEKPKGYSVQEIETISENLEEQEESNDITQPENLIVIMNESLSDFERIGTINSETEILPFLHSMKENTKKGWLQVPVMGRGTCDSEYEVLTGNTKQFLPAGSTAYELYCGNPEYGMIENLKQQGYKTIALHPENPTNWNRSKVYEEMGFDKFISIDNWDREIELLRERPSDKSAYDKVIELIDQKEVGEKMFTFLVTMQNHGGYTEEYLGDYTPTVSLNYDIEYPESQTYFSLINESDKAFEQLVKHFENVNEPTMIVMFGDHYPGLSDGLYETLLRWDDPILEVNQRIYQTPYVIWTNYEQESFSDDLMSANYFGSYILQQAGLELTPYNEFLLDLKESLPVIGMGAVCDKNGEWYTMEEIPEEYSGLLNQYKILQYNNVIDRKNRCEEVFVLE